MNVKLKILLFGCFLLALPQGQLPAFYPIDGYELTGIRRLDQLARIQSGELTGRMPITGALKSIKDIKLNLVNEDGPLLVSLPEPDPELQKSLLALFPRLDESYSVTLLDITPGKPIAFAQRQADRTFQPGSVGKLAVITAFMNELAILYPDSFPKRQQLMKTRMVRAGKWALYDEHTVPFWDPKTKKLRRRQVRADDVFSLYEWLDHMMSVSNNGAASVVWREAILIRVFSDYYPTLTEREAEAFFKTTRKSTLSNLALAVIREPLDAIQISKEEWRLGTFFTRGASAYIPPKGGSTGTPDALMRWMLAMESGQLIDQETSLEIKRLMYMTGRRIRYAANKKLNEAAVYFKSGSLYKCNRQTMPNCGKYRGNVYNYMNSVAIVEHPDSTTYLVALMSNVLRKNSNIDHNVLAGNIDKIVRKRHEP